MSQQDVELVRRLQPRPDVDLVALMGEEGERGQFAQFFEAFFHPDCRCVFHFPGAPPAVHEGFAGWREGWRDWTAPWASYRTEIEDLLDAGEHVVVLVRDYACRTPGTPEVLQLGAAVWTVRDGRVERAEFYTRRSMALEADGLATRR